MTTVARRWPILLVAILAQALGSFDYFAMGLALPSMAVDLGTTTTRLQWIISGPMIVIASLFIPGGRLADILGRRRVLITGLAIFAAASVLAGASSSAGWVIAFRLLQAVGSAAIAPASVACVSANVPREHVTRDVGIVFGTAAVGTAIGPFLGGALTDLLSWQWIFFFNALVALPIIVLARLVVPETRDESASRRIDWAGIALLAAGVTSVTLGVDSASGDGWLSLPVLGLVAAGVVLLGVFVAVERRVPEPLLDLGLFRIREFDVLLIAGSVGSIASVSMMLLITIQLQDVQGLSPLDAGYVFLAVALGSIVSGQVSGRLARFPAWWVMSGALLSAAVGLVGLALAEGWPAFLVSFFVAGFGTGLAWAFPSVATQGIVPTAKSGQASGIVLTVLVSAGGILVAATAAILDNQTAGGSALGDAVSAMLVGLAVVAVLGVVVTALFGRGGARRTVA